MIQRLAAILDLEIEETPRAVALGILRFGLTASCTLVRTARDAPMATRGRCETPVKIDPPKPSPEPDPEA